jgi:hypothetical protein
MVMSDIDATKTDATKTTLERLEDQIGWYDRSSSKNQQKFKLFKIVVITSAAIIPFLSSLPVVPGWIVGALGVLIAVLEGVQQLSQYHANWISYRSTGEALKREKFLFLASAGPYSGAQHPTALLAETIESLVSGEQTKWASGRERSDQSRKDEVGATPPP